MFLDFKVVHYLAIVKMLGDYTLILCLGFNFHGEKWGDSSLFLVVCVTLPHWNDPLVLHYSSKRESAAIANWVAVS